MQTSHGDVAALHRLALCIIDKYFRVTVSLEHSCRRNRDMGAGAVLIEAHIHHCCHARSDLRTVVRSCEAHTDCVQLIRVRFCTDARHLQGEYLVRQQVEFAIHRIHTVAVRIVERSHIDFYLQRTATEHRDDRHTSRNCLASLMQHFLHISVDRGVELGVSQLVAVIGQLLSNLFQSVASFVIVACCRTFFVIHGDDTISISLDALVLGLCSLQLCLIVTRIHCSQQLTFTHMVACLHIHLQDWTAHTERHIDIISRLRLTRESQVVHSRSTACHLSLHVLSVHFVSLLLGASTQHKCRH